MIELLLHRRNEELAALRSDVAARPKGDRYQVERAEALVAASPAERIAFDATGSATLDAGGQHFHAGRFATRSIRELKAAAQAARGKGDSHRVRLSVVCGADPLTDIGMMQAWADPGTVFQVASQFNCLEAPGPGVVPVRAYFGDPTQGPRASISAFAGTLVRHYAAPAGDGTRFVQTDDRQLNLLAEAMPESLGRVVGGYLMAQEITNLDRAAAAFEKNFEDIRVGVHDDVEVRLGGNWDGAVRDGQRIAQVFTSTFAGGGYSGSTRIAGSVEALCGSLLRAAYLGTMLAAAGLRKRTVVLTMIGGGVFGNPHPLIWDSILWAAEQTDTFLGAPLDVVLNGREVLETLGAPRLLEATRARGGTLVEVRAGVSG